MVGKHWLGIIQDGKSNEALKIPDYVIICGRFSPEVVSRSY